MQLDQGHFQDCLSRQDSYVNLENGGHVFSVAVNLSSGASAISQFSWTVGEQMLTFNSRTSKGFFGCNSCLWIWVAVKQILQHS
jgi:hypothetical protein